MVVGVGVLVDDTDILFVLEDVGVFDGESDLDILAEDDSELLDEIEIDFVILDVMDFEGVLLGVLDGLGIHEPQSQRKSGLVTLHH